MAPSGNKLRVRTFKTLRAQTRLALDGESTHSEFKSVAKGVDTDTLTSFANSGEGGIVLVGVADDGTICGTPTDDITLTAIQNKAAEAVPPVHVQLSIENAAGPPIIVIEIPPSELAPHSTKGGRYLTRAHGRKRALHPVELLQIFLKNESGAFLERFAVATRRIESLVSEMSDMQAAIVHEVVGLPDVVARVVGDAEAKITHATDGLEVELSQTSGQLNQVSEELEDAGKDLRATLLRLEALRQHFEIEDPEVTLMRNRLRAIISVAKKHLDTEGARLWLEDVAAAHKGTFGPEELKELFDSTPAYEAEA